MSKKLSIVIPVYNEEKTLLTILDKIREVQLDVDLVKEIVIVDDCSTDGTHNILASLSGDDLNIFYQAKNSGKGSAVRRGFVESTGDYILIQDADLEYDPHDYNALLQPLLSGRADVVFGSRFQGSQAKRVLYYWHYVGNKLITRFSNMLTNLNLTDMETCYKAFNRETLDSIKHKLTSERFGIEPEITALVAKGAWRIYEVGIGYDGRTYGEGKKINWKDGVAAFWHIIKFNLL